MDIREQRDFAISEDHNALPRDITRFQKFCPNGRADIDENVEMSFAALTTIDLICSKIKH